LALPIHDILKMMDRPKVRFDYKGQSYLKAAKGWRVRLVGVPDRRGQRLYQDNKR
jgi:hypothetical protein